MVHNYYSANSLNKLLYRLSHLVLLLLFRENICWRRPNNHRLLNSNEIKSLPEIYYVFSWILDIVERLFFLFPF